MPVAAQNHDEVSTNVPPERVVRRCSSRMYDGKSPWSGALHPEMSADPTRQRVKGIGLGVCPRTMVRFASLVCVARLDDMSATERNGVTTRSPLKEQHLRPKFANAPQSLGLVRAALGGRHIRVRRGVAGPAAPGALEDVDAPCVPIEGARHRVLKHAGVRVAGQHGDVLRGGIPDDDSFDEAPVTRRMHGGAMEPER